MNAAHDRAAARLAWTRSVLGAPDLTLATASSDASFRSYWRTSQQGHSIAANLSDQNHCYVVMDSPPALEDPRPWLAIGAQLAAAGVHVPKVYAQDLEQGFLLLEDLGTQLYLQVLNEANADALYGDAMDALLRMQAQLDWHALPAFDRDVLMRGWEVMPEWFLSRHLGHAPDRQEQQALSSAFEFIAANVLEQPRCFVHRDYHSRNLLVVDKRDPGVIAAELLSPGIIDFQGALAGPVTYDLASLLRDAYVTWPRERVEAWAESHRLRLREAGVIDATVDRARFQRWFDLTGLQRHTRVLGQFYRLWYRDGKPGYLADVPRIYHYVTSVARSYPELADFVSLLERHAQDRDLTRVAAA